MNTTGCWFVDIADKKIGTHKGGLERCGAAGLYKFVGSCELD
jgi:hypothetical protein